MKVKDLCGALAWALTCMATHGSAWAQAVSAGAGISSQKWHATEWPCVLRSSGTSCAHFARACGQRVRKRHPEGGLIGLGTSPCSKSRSRFRPGSGIGMADSKAWV